MSLQLSSFSLGPIALAPAPPGSNPSHVEFTLTSSGAPFSILGFYIEPDKRDAQLAGSVLIGLGIFVCRIPGIFEKASILEQVLPRA